MKINNVNSKCTENNSIKIRIDQSDNKLGSSFIASMRGYDLNSRTYGKKDILYYESAPAVGIFILQSGRVKLYKSSADGKQHILRIAGPGEVLALESIFTNGVYQTMAEMLEAGEVAFIDKHSAFDTVRAYPQVAMHVMNVLAKEVIFGCDERFELAIGSVRERMARLLSLLSKEHGVSDKGGIRINLYLSREEMAEMIGTAAETAMRLLKELREDNLIEIRGRDIIVLNHRQLSRAANFAAA